jgi:hypothetical protein
MFPHQNTVYASPLPRTRYVRRPSHSSWFYQPNNIGWAVQTIKVLIIQFSPIPCYLVPLRPQRSCNSSKLPVLKLKNSLFTV